FSSHVVGQHHVQARQPSHCRSMEAILNRHRIGASLRFSLWASRTRTPAGAEEPNSRKAAAFAIIRSAMRHLGRCVKILHTNEQTESAAKEYFGCTYTLFG